MHKRRVKKICVSTSPNNLEQHNFGEVGEWVVKGENFWVTLINILHSFSRPRVLAQICNLDQTEGSFWKTEISIWTIFINTLSGTRIVSLLQTCFGQSTSRLERSMLGMKARLVLSPTEWGRREKASLFPTKSCSKGTISLVEWESWEEVQML